MTAPRKFVPYNLHLSPALYVPSVSECPNDFNWNRASGGNYISPITYVSIFSKVFPNGVVLVRTFLISRFTILCRGRRCVVLPSLTNMLT